MMPVAWAKTYKGARVFNTTMGSSQDLAESRNPPHAGQRLLLGGRRESRIDPKSSVD